jgi:hypothetical protein
MSDVDRIMEIFEDFTDGYRLLILLKRNEHDTHGYEGFCDSNAIKRISKNTEEFKVALSELLELQKLRPGSRIYSCMNARNIDLVLMEFKKQLVEVDYFLDKEKIAYYLDIQKNFYSMFMDNRCRGEVYCMLDIDSLDKEKLCQIEENIKKITKIVLKYNTPRGCHFIVEAFEPKLFEQQRLKYDSFLLLSY